MFEVSAEPLQHWWPVVVKAPSSTTPGAIVEHRFEVLFETLEHDEAEKIDNEVSAAELAGDVSKRNVLLRRVVKDWKGVVDQKQQPIPFSTEVLDKVLQLTWNRIGFNRAWTAYQNGDPRLGN